VRVIDGSVRAACYALAIGGAFTAMAIAKDEPVKEAPITAAADHGGVPVLVQGTAHEALFGVAFDGDNGIAVGAMGEIQQSTDGGRTWKADAKPPTPLSLLGVGIHGEHRVAVGQMGTIVVSDGQGAWTKADSGTDARLFAASVNSDGLMVAVGAFGTVILSPDGGKTWQKVTIDWSKYVKDEGVEPHLYAVIVDEKNTVTLAGEYGLILRSVDSGKTWDAVNHGEASLFDIKLHANGSGYAVGQDGTVLATHDGGHSWTNMPTGSKAVLLGVWSEPNGHVLIAGMHQTLESHDGGQTWKPRTEGDFATGWYSGIAAPASGGLILIGNAGRIVKVDS
jgi:photosystem II stability/assembly factor-like uncharacterized protein